MPESNEFIQFRFGVQNDYDNLQTPNPNTVYVCTDTKRIFLGSNEYTQVGPTGKSAYESAIAGGYLGDERQFNTDLAQVSNKVGQLYVDEAIKTAIGAAIKASY